MKIIIECEERKLADLANRLQGRLMDCGTVETSSEVNLKSISTSELIAEIKRRGEVAVYDCDLYEENYRVSINGPSYTKSCHDVSVPPHCDVIVVSRSPKRSRH